MSACSTIRSHLGASPVRLGGSWGRGVGWMVGWGLLLATAGLLPQSAGSLAPASARADEADELEPYKLGVGFYERERYRQAVESLAQFLKNSPTNPKAESAQFVLGLAHVRLNEFAPAREAFRSFLKQYPQAKRVPQARYWVGHSSFQLRDYPAAKQELADFVAAHPGDAYLEHALPYLAEAQLATGQPQPALDSFNRALEKYPQGAMAADCQYGRAKAQEALGQAEVALASYRQLAGLAGHEYAADARMSVGNLLFSQKKFPEAAGEFARYVADFPTGRQRARAQLNQGYALYESQQYAEAEQVLRQAATAVETAAEGSLWVGLALKKQRQWQAAADWLLAAYPQIKPAPQAEQLLYQAGDALLRIGAFGPAQQRFEQLLAEWPQGKLREEALNSAQASALNSGDLAAAEALAQKYQGEFPEGRLRQRQAILRGRTLTVKGSRSEREGRTDEAQTLWRQAVGIFSGVVQGSEIESTRQQARYYWGEVLLKLADYPGSLQATAPLLESLAREPAGGDFVDLYLQRAAAHVELARQQSRAIAGQAPTPTEQEAIERECTLGRTDIAAYLERQPQGPLVGQAWSLTAIAAALAGDKPQVTAALQTLAEKFPATPDRETALLEVGEIAYARDDFAFAEQVYTELVGVTKDPQRRPRALADLGWSRARQERHPEAVQAFRQLVTEFPNHALTPEGSFMVGQSLLAAGQRAEAQAAFAQAFALPGESEHVFQAGWRCGRLQFDQGVVPAADATFTTLLQRFPRHPRADRALGDWATRHYDAERFERADALFSRLVTEYPQSPLAWNARVILAESELLADRLGPAREQFSAVAGNPQAEPGAAERALHQLQNMAREGGDWKEVRRLADESLTRFPTGSYRPESEFARAESLLMLEQVAEARAGLEALRARQAEPAVGEKGWFGRVFVRLAEAALREKQYDGVTRAVEAMQAWNPDSPLLYQIWEVQGRACKNQAQFPQAREWFAKTIASPDGKKTETAARAQLLTADTWVLEKNFESALDEYLKVDIGYDFPYWQSAALYHAGTCQESLGQPAAARRTYTRLLTQFPESEFAPKAKDRLAALPKLAGSPRGTQP